MQHHEIGAATGDNAQIERLSMYDTRSVANIAKEHVIGQDAFILEFARGIGLSVQSAIKRIKGADASDVPRATSLLVMGPTASGKTYAVRKILDAADIPFRLIDASALTGEGWRGSSVSSELAEVARWQSKHPNEIYAIIWDEADKMAFKGGGSDTDGSFNPQQNLLKLLDGEDIYTSAGDSGSKAKAFKLDCRGIINIFMGAFTGIEELIRAKARNIGFASGGAPIDPFSDEEARAQITHAHLIEYGFMPEFVGRIGAIFALPALDRSSLGLIVKGSAHSLERRYANVMPTGCGFVITDEARDHLVNEATCVGLGARVLDTAFCGIGSEALDIARADKTVCEITVGVSENRYVVRATRDDRSARISDCIGNREATSKAIEETGKYVTSDNSSLMLHAINGCIRNGLAFHLGDCISEDASFRRLARSLWGILGKYAQEDLPPNPGIVDSLEVAMRFLHETYPSWCMSLGDVYSCCSLDKNADEMSMWTPFEQDVKSCSWADCEIDGRRPLQGTSRRVVFRYVATPAKFRIENACTLDKAFSGLPFDGDMQDRIASIIESSLDKRSRAYEAETIPLA